MRVALRAPMVGKLGEEFDRVFDRLLVPRFLTEPLVPPFPFETTGAEWMPVMDMIETPTEYIVRLEVPGFHKENLDINLTGEVLSITGTRVIAPEIEGEGYLVKERVYREVRPDDPSPRAGGGEEGDRPSIGMACWCCISSRRSRCPPRRS